MSLTTIRLREAWNWGGLSTKQLAVRTYQQVDKHEILDRAAALAFYAMLSLIPFLSFLLALGLGGRTWISKEILLLSHRVLAPSAAQVLDEQIQNMQSSSAFGLLSFSTLILLYSASSVFTGIMAATNAAYAVTESRSWWKRQVVGVILAIVEAVLLIGSAGLVVAWPYVMDWMHLDSVGVTLASVVQWFVVLVAFLTSFAIAYYFGPNLKQEWEWITPGSAMGVVVLILASLGLRYYVQYGSNYSATYGTLAGVIIMLLWLYVASLALLVGAEINAVIENAAPHGRNPGQKVAPQSAPRQEKAT
ncbi:MAG TPA: YihY/virulence factor BrkB family protein [Gemmataceae bacterium]|nr:YihY/virulence factor BrkB family protein [Gemmataceae bacterium]